MSNAEDDVWQDHIVYMVRAYAAWYLVDEALRNLAKIGGEHTGVSRYHRFVSDAYRALDAFEPPVSYHVLHHDLLDTFVSIEHWLNGLSSHSRADLMEDVQIVGVELKEQMKLLGLGYL
jgi:hypothetical protein